jgi:O-methyltransferase
VSRTARAMGVRRTPAGAASASYPVDFSAPEIATWEAVRPYTMTSCERVVSLVRAVEYVVQAGIEGDLVECGVWRGGSVMAAIMTLQRVDAPPRRVHLFDTFEGMVEPTAVDYTPVHGKSASEMLSSEDRDASTTWAQASLDAVRGNIDSTGYPSELVSYVRGRVEETLPGQAPERVSILRLDTDWYESTRHELIHLYPRLVPGGILIIDDYGHWDGARKAVDEFMSGLDKPLYLSRIDYTGRIAIKR